MSRFNVTLAVAASTAALVMEGCKTSEDKKLANMYDKYEKEMNKATKTADHESKACDDVESKFQEAFKAEADKNKNKSDDDMLKELKKQNKNSKNYSKYLEECKKSTTKEEDSNEVQTCIADDIATKDTKKENKDATKSKDAELKYVQEYANCYITSKTPITEFQLPADNVLAKTYGSQFVFKLSDDEKTVTVSYPEAK